MARWRRSFEKTQDRIFYLLNIHFGIHARTIRTIIQDPDHGNRITILYPCCQIEFAGHCHDGIGSVLHNDPPGQRSPGGHGNLHMVSIRKINELLDFALSAAFAVLNISRDLDLAVEILNAMGKEYEQPSGAGPLRLGSDEMIVQLDEGLLHPLF